MENDKELKFQKEMKLLITIILYLLLAASFISLSQIERQKFDGTYPIIGANLSVLFLIGFGILFFSFMGYILKKNYSRWWGGGLGLLGAFFSLVFIKTFLDELKATESKHFIIKNINNLTIDSSIYLSFSIVLIMIIIFLLIFIFRRK